MAQSTLIVRSLTWTDTKAVLESAFQLGRENYLVFICFKFAQMIATQLLMQIPMVGFLALVFIQGFFTVSFVGTVEGLVRNKRHPLLKDLAYPYLHIDVVQKILPIQGLLFAVILFPVVLTGLGLFSYLMLNPLALNESFLYIGAILGVIYAAVFNLAGYLFYFGVLFVLQHKMKTGEAFRASFYTFVKNLPIILILVTVTVAPAAVGLGLVRLSGVLGGLAAKVALGSIGLLISPFFMSICYLLYRKAVTPPVTDPPPIIP